MENLIRRSVNGGCSFSEALLANSSIEDLGVDRFRMLRSSGRHSSSIAGADEEDISVGMSLIGKAGTVVGASQLF